ncbi:MAG: HAAS signaling domain-containing protein, partial [Candidatus Thorarchaeota archaeon SMTZ1-45]
MSDNEINHAIEKYMKRVTKLLPDSFETEDLIEDLKSHIYESFNEKIKKNPSDDRIGVITQVLEELGTPEEIADEYGREQTEKEEEKSKSDRWIYLTMRLMLVILVVVITSWIASILTEGSVDFMLAVAVLLTFGVFEWL